MFVQCSVTYHISGCGRINNHVQLEGVMVSKQIIICEEESKGGRSGRSLSTPSLHVFCSFASVTVAHLAICYHIRSVMYLRYIDITQDKTNYAILFFLLISFGSVLQGATHVALESMCD